jgi:hypothetical protein
MSRINYIFLDFENVQEADLDRIAGKPVNVVLVLGERNKSLPLSLVKLIHKYSERVRLIETVSSGKNALDFVLASEIGRQAERDPNGYFHIVSRDKGFDALIRHLKANGFFAARHASLSEISVLMNAAERVNHLISHYKANKNGRPKKRKTLESQILAAFGRALSPVEIDGTIKELIAAKIMTVTEKGDLDYLV